ncbi:hypothetical protein [Bifidobacterium sp.]|uniref:hypothetical protein n=1 Tax=Bifidobacterium sp. TaxID=41200 RepID=UPI0039E7E4B4
MFARSARKHGYTLADVTHAFVNATRSEVYEQGEDVIYKFTGLHHGDPLVPSIEVIMKRIPDNALVVFHVNAEQGTFWNRPLEEQYDGNGE